MKSLHWFSRLLAWPVSCPVAVAIVILVALPAIAEGVGDVTPTVGLRENAPTDVLLKGAVLVTDPEFYRDTRAGEPPSGDVLIRHGVIVAVGESILPPPGCRTIDCAGKMLYAG